METVTTDKFNTLLTYIEKVLTVISWSVTLFITFMIVIDVFLRSTLNKPLPASWEISEVIMPYIVFCALAMALNEGAHVKVSIVTNLLPARGKYLCAIFSNLFAICICVPFAYYSWLRFWHSFLIREEILAAIKIPWWLGKFAMPIGLAAFCARYTYRLVRVAARPPQ